LSGDGDRAATCITVESRGPVVVITVDRQQVRNAYDPPTLHAVAATLRRARDAGWRAAILTGAGPDSFSAGMDLRAMSATPPAETAAAVGEFQSAMEDAGRVPLVAAVNGPATGGGFETVLRCDLALAAEHATFRLPEVQRGIVPGGGATLLPARLPMAIAQELAIVGEPISAARAYELGLINRVVPAGELLDASLAMAARVAANGPVAVARTRALLWTTLREGVAQGWADTRRVGEDPEVQTEMSEGVSSFLEKRPPRW
jgi:enoyl-CoA hydratase/carnithine racemase